MNDEILNFKAEIQEYSVEQLEELSAELKRKMCSMIYEPNAVAKLEIVLALLDEKRAD